MYNCGSQTFDHYFMLLEDLLQDMLPADYVAMQ